MSNIDKRYLKDLKQKRFYPFTYEECVIDSEGGSLDKKLEELSEKVDDANNSKQDKINSTVAISVSPGVGVPSGTASFENNTLSIALNNIKGEQGEQGERGHQGIPGQKGNTGSSVEFPFTLVNDLISNDTESGLTAAMGSAIDNVNKSTITQTDYTNITYYIKTDGIWSNNGNHRSVSITVVPGDKYIITANNDYDTYYAFLASADRTANTAAPLVEGTVVSSIPAGTSIEVTIPETCKYINFRGCTSATELNTSGRLRCPSSFVRFEHISNVVEDIQNRVNNYIAIRGEGNSTIYSQRLYGILPNHSYKVRIVDTDVPVSAIPSNSIILKVYFGIGTSYDLLLQSSDSHIKSEYTFTVPEGASYMYFGGRCNRGYKIEFYVAQLSETISSTSILSLNPASEFVPKTLAARKRLYSSSDTNESYPLTFLHLSDIHGNWTNVSRFLEFANEYSNRLDDLINTGDTVVDHLSQGTSGYAAIEGVERIMNVIGNHDTRGDGGGMNWQDNIGLPAYQELIAPYVSNWNVVQPENAATEGYCYYYKDYTTRKTRLVVVDIMAYDDTEDTWLQGVLASAITAGLHVVIAVHYAGARSSAEASTERVFDRVPCSYTTLVNFGGASINLTNYNTNAYKMTASVSEFLDNGGHFVGYMQGHYHSDFIAKVNEDPRQLIYAISSSKAGELRDCNHIVGTRNQDEFQIVAIDPNSTIVKLFKVGANIDRYGRKKESICINYTTGKIVDAVEPVTVSGSDVLLEANLSLSEQLTTQDTTYVIHNDFNLNGESVAIPSGSTLKFAGGSISNGTLSDNPFTVIAGNDSNIFNNITFSSSYISNDIIYVDWFDFVTDGITNNYSQFKRLETMMNNKACGTLMFGKNKTYALKTEVNYRTNAYAPNTSFGIRLLNCSSLDINLNGSTITQLSSNTPMSTIIAFHNCRAKIHDGNIVGDRETHDYTAYTNPSDEASTDFEWNHGIVQAGGDIEFYNLKVSYFCGDGVVVGGGKTGSDISKHYHGIDYNIYDCEVFYCGRNGVTCHSSVSGAIKNSYIHHIGSYNNLPAYNPQSGIDFEFEDGLGDKPSITLSSLRIEDCKRRGITVASNTYFTKFVCKDSILTRANLTVQNLTNDNNGDCVFQNCDINIGDPAVASTQDQRNIGCGGRFVNCRFNDVTKISTYPKSFDDCIITTTSDTSGNLFDNGSVFPQGTSNPIPPTKNTTFNVNAGFLQLYGNQDSFIGNTINFNVTDSDIRMAKFKALSCKITTPTNSNTHRSNTNIGSDVVEFVDCDIKWKGNQNNNIAGYSSSQKVVFQHCRLYSTNILPRSGYVLADNCVFDSCSIRPVTGGSETDTVISNSTLRNCTGHYTKKAVYIGCSIYQDLSTDKDNKLGIGGSSATYKYDEFVNCYILARNFTNNTNPNYATYKNCVMDIDNSYLTGANIYKSMVYSSISDNDNKAAVFEDSLFMVSS